MTETETHISVPIKDDVVLLSLQYWQCQMNSHESNLGEHKRACITFRASASAAGWYFIVHSHCFSQAALIGRLSPPAVRWGRAALPGWDQHWCQQWFLAEGRLLARCCHPGRGCGVWEGCESTAQPSLSTPGWPCAGAGVVIKHSYTLVSSFSSPWSVMVSWSSGAIPE